MNIKNYNVELKEMAEDYLVEKVKSIHYEANSLDPETGLKIERIEEKEKPKSNNRSKIRP